ncbi:hypothetical protein [Planctomycetes bacterium Poly30]|uniref:hypothetical protein n=1 Tax=Saltatorellus ferox TaxID=2528018 RepID=UPI0011A69364
MLAAPFVLAHLPGSAAWLGPRDAEARAAMGPVQRALGPLASVAASVEWVRFRVALRSGDTARAYAIADSALELDPLGTSGWLDYAQHLIFERGSFLENESPEARRRWIQSGLDLLARGETVCRVPGELAFQAGLIRSGYLAAIPDEDLRWPGGPEALFDQGRRDLLRAVAAGRKGAREVLESLDEADR